MKLWELARGVDGRVTEVDGKDALTARLGDLGFVRGTRVRVDRIISGGELYAVTLRGYTLTLRRGDADAITVRCDS